MEITHITISVPETFSRDYWNRGNIAGAECWSDLIIKRKGSRVELSLTLNQIKDLYADAHYYATSSSYRYPDMIGLVSSARAVKKAIATQVSQVNN